MSACACMPTCRVYVMFRYRSSLSCDIPGIKLVNACAHVGPNNVGKTRAKSMGEKLSGLCGQIQEGCWDHRRARQRFSRSGNSRTRTTLGGPPMIEHACTCGETFVHFPWNRAGKRPATACCQDDSRQAV